MAKKQEEITKTIFETRRLKVTLTEKEIREASDSLAGRLDELKALEDEKKSITASFKSQIEAVTAAIGVQKNLVRDKYEYRPVRCKMILNFTKGNVVVTREDNGSIVQERPMNGEEKQMNIDFEKQKEEVPV